MATTSSTNRRHGVRRLALRVSVVVLVEAILTLLRPPLVLHALVTMAHVAFLLWHPSRRRPR